MPDPSKDAPLALRKRLERFGGLNPYGKPNWRVVLAQNCTEICGGIFHNMPDGELSIVEEGPDGKMYHREVKPESIEHHSMIEVPKYPHEGWILEIWFPAHMWGSREDWASHRAEDGVTPLKGPYPEQGDYWMLAGPWGCAPEISDVENAIAQYRQARQSRPNNLAAHMRQKLKDQEERKLKLREERAQKYIEYMTKEVMPLMKSSSLSAQRLRNQLAEDLKLHTHLAAGDF